ncbi:hypothetical protein Back2_18300 [Nocardioides baekrokdamisoli]|uniref:Fibronectin type-III domain-containing protein n=1 Tax=Nocardioides baekrokdamisoli TaxID=1804624 RepID=A0A3G9IYT4_9ACTN|nr:hypothetical protein Back2_18300 [Nocardioides baekrokdamisoli]
MVMGASAVLIVPAAANASVATPTMLAPIGAAPSSAPTFSWARVAGAVNYQIVVQNSSGQQVVNQTTANSRYAPTSLLADGSYTWEVRANGSAGSGSWASATMTVSPTAPPTLISPVGGQTLAQPTQPVLLKWSSVGGAVDYQIQVDSSGTTWTSPTNYEAKGNQYFVDTPAAPGTWYWRVRAVRGQGLYTSWSDPASYMVGTLADPTAGADVSGSPVMQDVRIDWQPVPGAMTYQVQVGRDTDFNNLVDDRVVDGTAYSPSTTYDNGQYYWRVRAIDAGQNRMPWTTAAPFTFQRNWPDRPTLEYPADRLSPAVSKPMFYQWTPVRHATRYQVDASTDVNFSPATVRTCVTSSTTLSPFESAPVDDGGCGPAAFGQGVAIYWRVRAIDDPRGVLGIYSTIRKYVYDSGAVVQTAPANGATVDVPTLQWNPVRDVEAYEVIVSDKNGGRVADVTTRSTSWTPEGQWPSASSPYSWTVQSVDARGSKSPLSVSGAPTFTLSGNLPTSTQPPLTPLTGVAGDPPTLQFPNLTWSPMPGAAYYRIKIGAAGSQFWDAANISHITAANYYYPAATDTDTHYLAAGDYVWQVTAYNGSNVPLGTSPGNGAFTIAPLAAATGQRISLAGTDSTAGATCDAALSNSDPAHQVCNGVPATPVLSWSPVPQASGYLVYLANDQALTNAVINPYAITTNTMFRPPSDLADNTAGSSYYWYIRPCKSMAPLLGCTADPASSSAEATNAFRKVSPAVSPTSPGVLVGGSAPVPSVVSPPTFSWTDYWDTNQGITYANGVEHSPQAARSYHLQISQSPTFTNLVDDQGELDQPFYSPWGRTLPQGLLYWRVQALDSASNRLIWSPTWTFSNDQPAIDLANATTAPAAGSTATGTPTFQWAPANGASSYQIEVYRSGDLTHSDANRLIQATVRVSAYVPQNYLPASSSAYVWRVRWFDADGQPRPWSHDSLFTVSPGGVTQTAPANGSYQPAKGLYLSWQQVPLAASYSVTLRDARSQNVLAQWSTAATSYAPDQVADGGYQWRVTALDPNGNPLAYGSWLSFAVDSQPPTVAAYSPHTTALPKSPVKVNFSERVLGVSAATVLLTMRGSTRPLPARLQLDSSGRFLTVAPSAALVKGRIYTVRLTSAIHDLAGNRFAGLAWSFRV